MRHLIACLALLFWANTVMAEDRVVAGLSQHSVSLTTGFSGSELFVYGAVRPDPNTAERPHDVIVAISGPSERLTVRRKVREFGIWINGPGVEIDEAPSYYAVASTRPLDEAVSWTEDLRHGIRLDRAIRLIDAPDWVTDREDYRAAVARIRGEEGLYAILPGHVKLTENTLFETRIKLPANLTEGDYQARVFLLRDKVVQDIFTETVEVRRAGIGRWIYTAAQEWPALYGIASIIVALTAGWLASAFFRTFFAN